MKVKKMTQLFKILSYSRHPQTPPAGFPDFHNLNWLTIYSILCIITIETQ